MYIGGSGYIFDYDSDKDGKIGSDKLSFSYLAAVLTIVPGFLALIIKLFMMR